MKYRKRFCGPLVLLGVVLTTLLVVSLACGAEATATPVPTVAPAPTAVPTAAPAPTVAPAPTATPAPTVAPTGQPVYGGTLRYALPPGMKTLNPHKGVDYKERYVEFSIYSGLVKKDPEFNIIPDLAESWDVSPDGKDITFHLRKGAKFSDGTDADAQAVKWNIDKIMFDLDYPADGRGRIGPAFGSAEAVDKETLVLHMKKAWRPTLGALSLSDLLMISPSTFEKYGYPDYGGHPAGSGPFKLKEWVLGSHMVIERNENYFISGLPYLDAIRYQFVPDTSVQLAMLRTGESDLIHEVPGTDMHLLEGKPGINTHALVSHNFENAFFRVTMPPFDNKALRQAINYAIDKQTLVDVHLGGSGVPADITFGYSWWGDPNYKPYVYNPQKAKEKLVEAGYPNGVTIPYWCEGVDVEIRECEIIQAMLAEVGIKVEITVVNAADFRKLRVTTCPMCRQSYSLRPDPDFVTRYYTHSEGSSAKSRMEYSNPELDKLVDQAAGIFDTAEAGDIYRRIYRIFYEDAPFAGLFFPTFHAATSARVQNFTFWPDKFFRFHEFWLKK